MSTRKLHRFEPLEQRQCLSVTATVSDGGDLIVEGDADGAVEIVAVTADSYRVTDNGVLIADETQLQGVTDDIHIKLEESVPGTNDTVTVDLDGQEIDKIYANLGDGDNTFELINGTASGLVYRGGDGIDSVAVSASVESRLIAALGDGDNDLTITGEVGNLSIHGGDDDDLVAIAESAIVTGGTIARLGDGDNSLALEGTVEGHLLVSARDGVDSVSIAEAATIGASVKLALGNGDNEATVAGTVDGNLSYNGGDGNDNVAIEETAVITESFFARVGEGENTVTHEGTVEGDFSAVSLNEEDTMEVSDTAIVGGETTLGPGEQQDVKGFGNRGFGLSRLFGRGFGFFSRGFRS